MEGQNQQEQQSQQLRDLEDRVAALEEEIKRLKNFVKPTKNKTDADICNECLPDSLRI